MWRGPKKRDFLSKLCTQEWIPGFPTLLLLVSQRGRENDSTTSISKFMSYLNLPVYYRTHWMAKGGNFALAEFLNLLFWTFWRHFSTKGRLQAGWDFYTENCLVQQVLKGSWWHKFPPAFFSQRQQNEENDSVQKFSWQNCVSSPNCIYNKF